MTVVLSSFPTNLEPVNGAVVASEPAKHVVE